MKVCFLNAINAGLAFEKLKYFEESILMEKKKKVVSGN